MSATANKEQVNRWTQDKLGLLEARDRHNILFNFANIPFLNSWFF